MTVEKDIVIGLDSSTQSAKAIAWNRHGTPLAEGRADIALSQPQPGYVEQSPSDWWAASSNALRDLTDQINPDRIAALAISNQRETIGFFDDDMQETRPAITWLDDRALDEIENLTTEFGADRLHQITGRPPFDATVAVHSLSWMKRNQPEVWARSSKLLDAHGVLTYHLTGTAVASTTSIDAFTVFDIRQMQLSDAITAHLGLDAGHFAQIQRPGSIAGHVSLAAEVATGLPQGLPIVVGGGDGQCAALGVQAGAPGSVFLNLGTAIIAGCYAKDPLISQYWRTVTSPTGEGYFLEGCQRAGTFLLDWLCTEIGGQDTTAKTFKALEEKAVTLPVGSDGVTMSPYLLGCMDPHWDRDARAAIMGLSPNHSFVHVFRASLEATALQIARYIDAVRAAGMAPDHIVAVGGGSSNALWTGMIADACGLPIVQCQSAEASSLGAAITAAVGVGWYRDFDEASEAMVQLGSRLEPNAASKPAWDQLSARQAQSYVRH